MSILSLISQNAAPVYITSYAPCERVFDNTISKAIIYEGITLISLFDMHAYILFYFAHTIIPNT